MRNVHIMALAAAMALVACVSPAPAQESEKDSLAATRNAVSQWVETQQIISKERNDWQRGKEVLEERIDLLQGEIDGLEEKIGETGSTIGEVDTQRRELISKKQSLQQASNQLQESIGTLEAKTQRLVPSLPDLLQARLAPLTRRIPEDPANTNLSLSERFQSVIGVLNEINKFNRDITVSSELRELAGGRTAEVETLYIGLATAYYVTQDETMAGIGRPTPDGWEWSPADELAADIRRTIKIFKNEDVPAYVPLPVTIQ